MFRRLRRRLAIGLFLDLWPAWAAVALVLAGTIVLLCRVFVPAAASFLPWLWLAPVVTAVPVLVICVRRTYRPDQVAALADWLAGGQGILLTLFEKDDSAWTASALAEQVSRFPLPKYRVRPALIVVPAALFLAVALWLPQRVASPPVSGVLAQEVATNLTSALVELEKQQLLTPEEEEQLQEEVERIQRNAEKRMDASTWEAADALREKVVAGLSEKQDAVKWAQDALARVTAAVQAGGAGDPNAVASAAELAQALEKLAQSGLLGGKSADLKGLLSGGKLPADAAALAALLQAVGDELAAANGRFAGVGNFAQAFGRFDPSEFGLEGPGRDGDGLPGQGGVTRGRADAKLTWGEETQRVDKFKSKPLPPGAPRSPDDWAPVVVLPGAPEEAAVLSARSAGREYAAGAGQGAWRRSLAPRHQSAVKKYFDASSPKRAGGGSQGR